MQRPAYLKIKTHIVESIRKGRWREGDLIPSENELAAQFQVARMTVNRAVQELANERVLVRVKGAGTYVAEPRAATTLLEIRSIKDEIEERGATHATRVLTLESVSAGVELSGLFSMPRGTRIGHARLLHLADDEPLQLEERWVAPELTEAFLEQDFTQTTPHAFLSERAPLARADYAIEARTPTVDVRRLLAMRANEPALLLVRRTWSERDMASYAHLWHPGSRHRFTGEFCPRTRSLDPRSTS